MMLLSSDASSYNHHLPACQCECEFGQLAPEINQWKWTVDNVLCCHYKTDHTCCCFFQLSNKPPPSLFHRWAWCSTEENIHQMDKCTVLQGNVKDYWTVQVNAKLSLHYLKRPRKCKCILKAREAELMILKLKSCLILKWKNLKSDWGGGTKWRLFQS